MQIFQAGSLQFSEALGIGTELKFLDLALRAR
jgi:hypothetical protein